MDECMGKALSKWKSQVLWEALVTAGATHESTPLPDGGTKLTVNIPARVFRVLKGLFGTRGGANLESCLARELAGVPPPSVQRSDLLFDIVVTAAEECLPGKELSDKQEEKIMSLIQSTDDIRLAAEDRPSAVTPHVGFRLEVEEDALEALAEVVAARGSKREEVETLRQCFQAVLGGWQAPGQADYIPMVADTLIGGSIFYCTDMEIGEHGLEVERAYENLMKSSNIVVKMATNFTDGEGGFSGTGRGRYVAHVPLKWVDEELLPLFADDPENRAELRACLLDTDRLVAAVEAEEELALMLDWSNANCLRANIEFSGRQYERTRRFALQNDPVVGAEVADGALEMWIEAGMELFGQVGAPHGVCCWGGGGGVVFLVCMWLSPSQASSCRAGLQI